MFVHNEPITLVLTYGAVVTISKVVMSLALFSGAAYVLPKIFAFLKGDAESDKKGHNKGEDKNKDKGNDAQGPEKKLKKKDYENQKNRMSVL